MKLKMVGISRALITGAVLLFMQGCASIDTGSGTKVTLSLPAKGVTREKIAATCVYLAKRGYRVVGAQNARVDTITDDSLILLLPGVKASKNDVNKVLTSSSIELYHLKNLATKYAPNRPWKVKIPSGKSAPFLFLGPDAKRIDGSMDSQDLLKEVAGCPNARPVITGADIQKNATMQEVKSGWAVLIKFTPCGSKTFYKFTKDHSGEYLAVFCNGELISAPVIEKPVEGGQVFITGFKSVEDARGAVDDINAGNLPFPLKIKSIENY